MQQITFLSLNGRENKETIAFYPLKRPKLVSPIYLNGLTKEVGLVIRL